MNKVAFKNMLNLKNITQLLFIFMFFNVTFIGYLLYFNCFNWIYLLGNLIIFILFIAKNINKKIDAIINIIISIILIVLFIIFYQEFINGFKISCNNIFSKSQELTTYKYTFYQIDLMISKQKFALMVYVLITSYLYSMIIFNTTRLLKMYLILIFNIPFLILSVYFGVGFNILIVILLLILNTLFIILNTYLNSKSYKKENNKIRSKNIALLLSFSIIFSGSLSLVTTNYNTSVEINNIANNIRDYFSDVKNDKDADKNNNTNNNEDKKDDDSNTKNDDKKDEGGKKINSIPILLIILDVLLAIVFIIPIILIIIENYRNRKHLRLLNSDDKKIAIKTNYLESIKILRKLGINYQNKGYKEYINDVDSFGDDYKKLYEKATDLYLKSSYSDNLITEEDVKLIKEFYISTCNKLKEKSNIIKRTYWRMIKKYEG